MSGVCLPELTPGQITECKRASVVKAVVSNLCGWDLSICIQKIQRLLTPNNPQKPMK